MTVAPALPLASHDPLEPIAALYGVSVPGLRRRVRELFGTDSFAGLDVLDVGAGRGMYSCAVACLGARQVTALEPEASGARSGVATILEESVERLGLTNVRIVRARYEEFHLDAGCLDHVLLRAVINHLDEAHVRTLHRSAASRARFLELLTPLAQALRPGGRLAAYDVTRTHALSLLIKARFLRRDPRFPTIEWDKHQDPVVWERLLRECGFREVGHRWSCRSRFPWLRELTARRRWLAFWLAPHFVLTATR